jgi:hypothetical protein
MRGRETNYHYTRMGIVGEIRSGIANEHDPTEEKIGEL